MIALALALSVASGLTTTPDLAKAPLPRPLAMDEVQLGFAPDQRPDLTGFYPKAAQARAVQGSADVMCRIGPDQKLSACTPVKEAPQGEGFGTSAANLFSMMQVAPRAADGSATANRDVLLHFNFKLNN